MRLEIKLFATLRPYMTGICDKGWLDVPEGTTVSDVVALLNLPEKEVRLIFVNGRHTGREHRLCPGDRLGIFPPVGGG